MVLIFLGPPGVGKGVQGVLLAESLDWERLATGDLLRAALREGTELGKRARSFMDQGDLVPDELIVALVRDRLEELPEERGVILDGFPRTLPQAEALGNALPDVGREVDGVLVLEAPDEVLIRRVAGRRNCPQCGRVFNVHFDPPITSGICDECGARLEHRKDDSPETVQRRLQVYAELTEPLIGYYESTPAVVIRVDGDRSMDAVQKEIWKSLNEELEV